MRIRRGLRFVSNILSCEVVLAYGILSFAAGGVLVISGMAPNMAGHAFVYLRGHAPWMALC